MWDKAIHDGQKPGQRTDLLDNVQEVKAPTGNARDAALRRLLVVLFFEQNTDASSARNAVPIRGGIFKPIFVPIRLFLARHCPESQIS